MADNFETFLENFVSNAPILKQMRKDLGKGKTETDRGHYWISHSHHDPHSVVEKYKHHGAKITSTGEVTLPIGSMK